MADQGAVNEGFVEQTYVTLDLRTQLARDLAVAAVGARCFGAPSTIKHLAQDAVTLADAILAALAKPQEGGE